MAIKMTSLAKQVGREVSTALGNTRRPLIEAASRAISQRIPLVDFVLDVRDARLPLSSECHLLHSSSSSRRIVIFNKLDLAGPNAVKECMRHFEERNFAVSAVNSHNNRSVQQGQVRSLRKIDHERNTITMMLTGIPNVGKSALANALHQIGRISAAEKGKLKHAVVTPLPGETKSISSLKIASHPSVYVLDTPGLLPPQINDIDVCAKLALTGAISDSLAGEKSLARLFLSILNQCKEHEKWEKQSTSEVTPTVNYHILGNAEAKKIRRNDFSTDHTKDSVVRSVRKILAEAISSFKGNIHEEEDMLRLIQDELISLREAFNVHTGSEKDIDHKIAVKLLTLFRTGRLGKYMLDSL